MSHEDIKLINDSQCLSQCLSIYTYDLHSGTDFDCEPNSKFLFLDDIVIHSDESSTHSEDEIIQHNSFSSILLCEPTKTCQKCLEECSSFHKKLKSNPDCKNPKTAQKSCNIKELKNRKNGTVKQNLTTDLEISKNISNRHQKHVKSNSVKTKKGNTSTSVTPCSLSKVNSDSFKNSIGSTATQKCSSVISLSLENAAHDARNNNVYQHLRNENRLLEKKNRVEDSVSVCAGENVCSSIQKMSEHSTPHASSSSKKRGTEVDNLTKKRCTFPVRRTKAKPLPILDDDDYLPRKKFTHTHTSNTTSKYDRAGTPTNRNFTTKATAQSTTDHRSSAVEENQYLVIQIHSDQPLDQSGLATFTEAAAVSHMSNDETVYSDSYLNGISPPSLPSSSSVSERTSLDMRLVTTALLPPRLPPREELITINTIESNVIHKISHNKSETLALESNIHVPAVPGEAERIESQLPDRSSDVRFVHGRTWNDSELAESTISYHPPEIWRNKKNVEKLVPLRNNGIFAAKSFYNGNHPSASTLDFDTKHIIDLLVLVNISGDFLGCLKDALGDFVNEAKGFVEDKRALMEFLSDRNSIFLLEACQEMLVNCHLETGATNQFEDIQLSVDALWKLFKYLKKSTTSNNILNVQKLAAATVNLSTTEISTFLKTLVKFKDCNMMSQTDFASFFQSVVTCQLGMTLTDGNFHPTPPNPLAIIPATFSSNTEYCSVPLFENGGLLGRLQSPNKPSISSQSETFPSRNTNFCESNVYSYDNDDASSNSNSSSLPFSLGREDLEKLVNNFSFLESEYRQAIRDYIKVLGHKEPLYAASLLKRIDWKINGGSHIT